MFNSSSCANAHVVTIQNNNKCFYKTFNNTMYTGAAQANVMNAAVSVIIMSHTTPSQSIHPYVQNTYGAVLPNSRKRSQTSHGLMCG